MVVVAAAADVAMAVAVEDEVVVVVGFFELLMLNSAHMLQDGPAAIRLPFGTAVGNLRARVPPLIFPFALTWTSPCSRHCRGHVLLD